MDTQQSYEDHRKESVLAGIKAAMPVHSSDLEKKTNLKALLREAINLANIYEDDGARMTALAIRTIDVALIQAALDRLA